jgi:hypothetical protein
MLSALFAPLGKKGDNAARLEACVDMFAPGIDEIGEATGLWLPIPKSPVILALAVKRLIHNAIFTPMPAELRREMREANRNIVSLANITERWLNLLRNADRIFFEHDRAQWTLAYQNIIGSDVVRAIQDPAEAGDEDEDEPATARWAALEKLRLARLIE